MPSWGERLGSIKSIDRRPLGAGQICKDALEATTPGTLGVGMIPPPIIEWLCARDRWIAWEFRVETGRFSAVDYGRSPSILTSVVLRARSSYRIISEAVYRIESACIITELHRDFHWQWPRSVLFFSVCWFGLMMLSVGTEQDRERLRIPTPASAWVLAWYVTARSHRRPAPSTEEDLMTVVGRPMHFSPGCARGSVVQDSCRR